MECKKYLLVEDDNETAEIILKGLRMVGYEGDWVTDGLAGLQRFRAHRYDFVISDVLLPMVDGFDLVRRIRQANPEIPILLLSGLKTSEDRVRGLSDGADDFVCKPFSLSEIQIRIKNLLRTQGASSVLCIGDLRLDRIKRTLNRGEKQFEVLEREFMLLDLFISNPDKIISKEHILREICGYNFTPNTNIVDVLICRLRDKISAKKGAVTIRTIRGLGYKLHVDGTAISEF